MDELIRKQDAIDAAIKADMENHNGILSEKRARAFEEHIAILPPANNRLIQIIEKGIKATGTADEYSVGMCNGMKWCKALIDGKEPVYAIVQPKLTHDTAQPTITHEQAIDYLHKTGWLQSHDRILTEHEQMYKKRFRLPVNC